jgi:DNA (cytosine-5)-methyltransferase 1
MGKHCQGQTEVNIKGIGPTIRAEHHGNISNLEGFQLRMVGNIVDEINKLKLKQRRLTPENVL